MPKMQIAFIASALVIFASLQTEMVHQVDAAGGVSITGWVESSAGLPASNTWAEIDFGDMNNDGFPDLVFTSFQGQNRGIRVFSGNGGGSWTNSSTGLPVTGDYSGARFVDINRDGFADLISASDGGPAGNTGVRVWKGNGGTSWVQQASPTANSGAGIEIADMNRDGNVDLITGYWINNWGPMVFLGNGNFGWGPDVGPASTMNVDDVAVGDVNKDGFPDFAASSMNSIGIQLWTGDGTGTNWVRNDTGLPTSGVYLGLAMADVNNDGNPDLAAAGYGTQGMYAWTGNGGAGGSMRWYPNSTGLPTTGMYSGVEIADINGDGNPDLLYANTSGGGIGLMGGNGGAGGPMRWTNISQSALPTSGNYWGVRFGDVNNDSVPDIGATRNGGVKTWITQSALNLTLLSPIGGEDWSGGSVHTVKWNISAGRPPFTVNIAYSADGGMTFPFTVASVSQVSPGDWSYDWTLPAINSSAVRVRINASRPGGFNFTASGNLKIDSAKPYAADSYPPDGATNISTSTGVAVNFSEGMNRTVSQGAFSISGPGSPALAYRSWNGNELAFQTSGLLPGSVYRVTVSTAAKDDSDPGNGLAAQYSFSFNTSAVPVPAISLDAPVGGEMWVAGERQNITWSAAGGTGALSVSLVYSTTGADGAWSEMAAGEANDGSYEWTVPGTPSTDCYVRATVSDSNSPPKNVSAVSPQFTIKAAPVPINLTLTTPNGGEEWTAGTVQNITWSAAGGNGALNITLRYSTAGPGGPWTDIAANNSNDGVFRWTVPDTPTTGGFIRVSARDGYSPPQTAADAGDAPFTIKAAPVPVSITLTAPNGGEVWTAGTQRSITWNATGGNGALSISLAYSTTGAGGPWLPVASGEANDGNYLWRVPATPSADCFVRATATDGYAPPQNASDASNGAFTINTTFVDAVPPTVQIVSPANGAVVNGTVPIQVTASDNVRVAKIEVFVDGVSVGLMTAAPFNVTWNTKLHTAGTHTITARAWDTAGNAGNATPVVVTVKNTVPKTVGGQSSLPSYLWLLVAIIAATAVGVAAALMMRRKRGGPSTQAPPPPMYQQPPAPPPYG